MKKTWVSIAFPWRFTCPWHLLPQQKRNVMSTRNRFKGLLFIGGDNGSWPRKENSLRSTGRISDQEKKLWLSHDGGLLWEKTPLDPPSCSRSLHKSQVSYLSPAPKEISNWAGDRKVGICIASASSKGKERQRAMWSWREFRSLSKSKKDNDCLLTHHY